MEEVCRLCFGIDLVNIPIFGEDNGIYKKLIACLPIHLRDVDSLPKKICDPCNDKIEEFYSFREKTLETENKLYMLTQIKSLEETGELNILKTDSIKDEDLRALSNTTKSTQTDDVITDLPNDEIKTETLSICSDRNDHFDDVDAISNADLKDDKELRREREETEVKEKKRRRYKKSKKRVRSEDDVALISLKGSGLAEESPSPDDMSLSNFIAERMKAGSDTETWIKKEELDDEDGEAYCCCVCYKFQFSKNEMLTHYRTHKYELEKGFEDDLRSGKCEPNSDGQYQCILCKNTFDELANLVNHVTIHRAGKPYRCTLCEKTFSEAMHILKHGKTHVYENCTIENCPTAHLGLCPKEHRMISKAIPKPVKKRYVCDICTEEFVYMRYLKSHRTLEHPEAKDRQFVNRCMHCFREFSHINSLRRHLRSHSGERNFLCYVCGKALSSREHLKFHISIHTGHKPHICKTCGKGFVKKCNLTLHERVHSGERPHVCTHCGKAFSQRSTLVIHERYHSGARPYVCVLCKKGFVAKGLLSMHIKTTCI